MLNVICLKHGTKYNVDYVNKLYNMIQRHLTIPHRFVCFTDDVTGINPLIETRMLPESPISGWWWKPYIFKAEHFPRGDTNFYIDLDMIIVKNIDHYMDYLPGSFVGLRDVGRVFRQDYKKLGSAVLKWPAGEYADIWERFAADFTVVKRLHGDQDWIWELHKNDIKFFPDPWIRSYKWEIRNRSELETLGPSSRFSVVRDPVVPSDTSILAFHGYPHIHTVLDPVIVNNWV
jgi:hypothetical protein